MTWSHVYRDYWGAHVTAMEAIGDHSCSRSRRRARSSAVTRSLTDRWHVDRPLPTAALLDLQNEYVTNTERTDPGEEIVERVRRPRTAHAA